MEFNVCGFVDFGIDVNIDFKKLFKKLKDNLNIDESSGRWVVNVRDYSNGYDYGHISITVDIGGHFRSAGIAELSFMHPRLMYFNRLYVDKKFRRHGIGKFIVKTLHDIIITSDSNVDVLLEVNPYGDGGPEINDLCRFYYNHGGFKHFNMRDMDTIYFMSKHISEFKTILNSLGNKYVMFLCNNNIGYDDNNNMQYIAHTI